MPKKSKSSFERESIFPGTAHGGEKRPKNE
jgi:hypothetical protein